MNAVMSLNTVNVSTFPSPQKEQEFFFTCDTVMYLPQGNTENVNGTTPAEIRNAQSAVM